MKNLILKEKKRNEEVHMNIYIECYDSIYVLILLLRLIKVNGFTTCKIKNLYTGCCKIAKYIYFTILIWQ